MQYEHYKIRHVQRTHIVLEQVHNSAGCNQMLPEDSIFLYASDQFNLNISIAGSVPKFHPQLFNSLC